MSSCIFLDIDGPMIPMRAYYLPNQTFIVSYFDPCAVYMLLDLIKDSGAQLVISSTHRFQGREHIDELLTRNNIPLSYLHNDWHTSLDRSLSRTEEIQSWLNEHPEVNCYIAIDDEILERSLISTKCCAYEGFSIANLTECRIALNAYCKRESGVSEAVQLERWQSTLQFLKS